MKQNTRKKVKKTGIIALVLMITTLAFSPTYVNAAGNYKDTWYYYDYQGDGGDFFISSREKRDYTSCYIKNLHRQYVVIPKVFSTGAESESGYRVYEDCSVYEHLVVNPGEAKYIPNYVRERGYRYCTLLISPGTHLPSVFSGLWSPDSI